MTSKLAALAGRPVFSIEGAAYTWGDVVEAARLRGEWAALERETRRGLLGADRRTG